METLKDLASVTDEHGVAMTAYIDLDPSDSATPKERESHEHAVLDELRRYHPGDASHEAKLRFEATLARVSARLADLDLGAGRHRGAAVYAWGEDGIEAEGFRERVEDHSVVGRRLSLTTAATRASRGDDVLILIASREAGHLYRYRRGELETTFDDSESVQEIDIDNHVHIHRVVEHLVKLHDRIGRPPVAIVADSTLQPVIAERLTPTVAEVAIRVERNEANWRTEDILTVGEHALAERDRARQAELLGHWQTQSGRTRATRTAPRSCSRPSATAASRRCCWPRAPTSSCSHARPVGGSTRRRARARWTGRGSRPTISAPMRRSPRCSRIGRGMGATRRR